MLVASAISIQFIRVLPNIDFCTLERVRGELVIHQRNQLLSLVTELPLRSTTLFGYV